MADDQKHTPRPSAEGAEPGHHVEMMVRTPTQKALEHIEDEELKDHEHLPAPDQIIEDLGIPNWRELEKKVVRRLDMTLMPCLWVLYLFNYLDRASIAQARVSTLDQDLGLEDYQYSTAVTILSVGYVIGQIPSNMIIGKVRPSIYLCCMAMVWSGVSAATCGAKDYKGLVLVRFFLGLVEAPLFPGAIYLLGCWHTRKEVALRVAILYTGQTLAYCCAGLIAAAVFGTLSGKAGLAGWQWLFIVLASVGGILALICAFFLPDYPHSKTGSARWSMTEDMRKVAAARIIADRVSTSEAKAGVWQGLKMSVKDIKLWALVGVNIGLSAAYGFSNFYPSIVEGFGYNRVVTLLLTAPPYIFAAIGSLVNSWHSDKVGERGFHFSGPVGVGCIGYIICLITQNGDARYAASFIFVGGMYISNSLVMSWVTGVMGRTPENRAVSVAIVNVLGQVGNVIAPYFFVESDRPRYQMAFILMMVFALLAVSCAMLLKIGLVRANKRLYREAVEEEKAYQPYLT
ncbi:MFS general substrate transporter [Hortaea werneckii]|nr:MFS general substrate transporter [Hortaea werneckii]KAI7721397.1 MFS general substrate transporter [Hortaea werneckii]